MYIYIYIFLYIYIYTYENCPLMDDLTYLLRMRMFHTHVSLLEGNPIEQYVCHGVKPSSLFYWSKATCYS